MTSKKTGNRTSIALSIETKEKLHRVKTLIEKIVRKNIDYDQALLILLSTKALDDQLTDIILED